jgi:CheY-like chemotaxis protein
MSVYVDRRAASARPVKRFDFMSDPVRTVLLVEDEPLVRRTTADLLAEDGYRVLEAASYDEALDCLGTCPDVAALVTDIGISGDQDGIALTRAVRERCPHVRIVLVSGRMRPRADQYPPDAIFFTKPYAPSALLTVVRQSIAGELEPRTPALA